MAKITTEKKSAEKVVKKLPTPRRGRGGGSDNPDPVDVHVGARLRQRRGILGFSQEKLADALGLTFQQVQKYERGTNRISASRLWQACHVLDVPVSYFFEGFSDKGRAKTLASGLAESEQLGFEDDRDILSRKETLELVRLYYTLDDENARRNIMKTLRNMVEFYQEV